MHLLVLRSKQQLFCLQIYFQMQKRVRPAFQGPVRLQENLFWGKIVSLD